MLTVADIKGAVIDDLPFMANKVAYTLVVAIGLLLVAAVIMFVAKFIFKRLFEAIITTVLGVVIIGGLIAFNYPAFLLDNYNPAMLIYFDVDVYESKSGTSEMMWLIDGHRFGEKLSDLKPDNIKRKQLVVFLDEFKFEEYTKLNALIEEPGTIVDSVSEEVGSTLESLKKKYIDSWRLK